jgi:hypothetical protein
MSKTIEDETGIDPGLIRRELFRMGGVTLAGLSLAVFPSAQAASPATDPPGQGCRAIEKQVYVATARDPVAYSIADNLFWNDIMMEHSKFFVNLMPGPELASQRAIAQQYQQAFAQQFANSQHLGPGNYRAFNQRTIDLARRIRDQKLAWEAQQEAGQLRSLVWPVFFKHTAREADRFANRLTMYSSGNIEFERPEVVDFWSKTMSEHAGMIAHLLDPQERPLIVQATAIQDKFANPAALQRGPGDPVMVAAQEIIDFKTTAELRRAHQVDPRSRAWRTRAARGDPVHGRTATLGSARRFVDPVAHPLNRALLGVVRATPSLGPQLG